jgi:hypothetical protein
VLIATSLLPGPPADHPERVGSLGFPAATPFGLHAAYWFRVPDGLPVTRREGEPTQAGDYLLIETDPAWTRRTRLLAGRLIAVRHPEDRSVILARVAVHEDYFQKGQYDLDTFDDPRREQILVDGARDGAQARPSRARRGSTNAPTYFAEDVVGVVLQRLAFEGPG